MRYQIIDIQRLSTMDIILTHLFTFLRVAIISLSIQVITIHNLIREHLSKVIGIFRISYFHSPNAQLLQSVRADILNR